MTKLNLEPLVEAYNWLAQNEEHFSMAQWFGQKSELDDFIDELLTIPAEPECGTVMCLCGSALLLEARRVGSPWAEVMEYEDDSPDAQFMAILRRVNPEWGSESEWEALAGKLEGLFLCQPPTFAAPINMKTITLPTVRAAVNGLCAEYDYTPQFID